MKRNVASQSIGCQMITAADGTAFTSTVTVYVTGDAGTQAIGSVGSGVCTHEGNGYHTYAPAQAETNYDLTAFTFIGTGAIPSTIQVYNSFPQTVDNATQLALIVADTNELQTNQGNWLTATGFATSSALTTVDTVVDGIQTDLSNATDGLGALKTLIDTVNTDLSNPTDGLGAIKADTAAILIDTADIQPKIGTPAGVSVSADIAAVKADSAAILVDTGTTLDAAIAVIDANVDSILVDTGTTLPATLAALNDISVADVLTTQMTEAYAADGAAPTLAQALMMIQQLLGEFSISGTTLTLKKVDGSTTAATFTLNDGTNPTSLTRST